MPGRQPWRRRSNQAIDIAFIRGLGFSNQLRMSLNFPCCIVLFLDVFCLLGSVYFLGQGVVPVLCQEVIPSSSTPCWHLRSPHCLVGVVSLLLLLLSILRWLIVVWLFLLLGIVLLTVRVVGVGILLVISILLVGVDLLIFGVSLLLSSEDAAGSARPPERQVIFKISG